MKLTIQKVNLKDIKTDYYYPEMSQELLSSFSTFQKTIFPLEKIVVHKETMQLIANGHYYQLAMMEGLSTIEVVLVDFPLEHLLHAILTHWKPSKYFTEKIKHVKDFTDFFKKNRDLIQSDSPHALREMVAEVLGTNRSYLDKAEAIAKYNPFLLDRVDKNEISLNEAFDMIPKKGKSKSNRSDTGTAMNYTMTVTDITELTTEEIQILCANLPNQFAVQLNNGIIPTEIYIAKCFTYNKFFQGFSISYDHEGVSVTLHIIYTDNLEAQLRIAA